MARINRAADQLNLEAAEVLEYQSSGTSPRKKIERNPGANVTRGELYRVHKPGGDPKEYRTFVIASRRALIDSRFSTVVCATVFTAGKDYQLRWELVPKKG